MAKAKRKPDIIQGPNGEKLVITWMNDGRVRMKFSGKIAISAFFPGANTKPEAKIIIQRI
ncbi:MAG: hypothetical protein KKE00_07975 [Proteobacteria bacterium]|nr:hypothetical protein [Pseudomonadota bacterium]MBU2483433.1 hypothetical protein [Pseudomonadota bacterium]MBU2572754.1 hypothetical protein [Elusimicrobiota bacterium]